MKKPLITITLTQYNEEKNLKNGVLDKMFNYLEKQDYEWEVILNDDGSTDKSKEYVQKYNRYPNFKFIQGEHRGKAGGLNNAIKEAKGEWILFTDIDQSTPINQLEKLLPFTKNYEVIIGSRGFNRKNTSLIRKLASQIFRLARSIFILKNIKDTQCGFKLFRGSILKKVFPHLDAVKHFNAKGWNVTAFDVELLFIFDKLGYKIKEVNVEWKNEDISDTKQRKFVKESVNMAKQVITVIIKNMKSEYEYLKDII